MGKIFLDIVNRFRYHTYIKIKTNYKTNKEV